MIVEAPMGEGKTEAALYAADLAMCRGFARGLYVAMPTQATGNAMYKRVLSDYLRKRGHRGKLNLQLVHSDALLARMAAEVKEGEIPEYVPESISEQADVDVQGWFTAKKRPLLAPFGVGTIDQSLLSVLQTKHWFVRLFGLAGKVVVFDEVHAYDAYMSTILERLLRWLAELGCTVILLSATLPEAKRAALAQAYSGEQGGERVAYPRTTLAKPLYYSAKEDGRAAACEGIPVKDRRIVCLQLAAANVTSITDVLVRDLGDGGCAAVICNTVNRSIEVFEHLRANLDDTKCLLFHARTLQEWRRGREQQVLRKFGKGHRQDDGTYKNQDRPKRVVLVATQVIEQSLDLDFDLLVSEIAPVDLLLQRAGRLHRHNRTRPPSLTTPRLVLLCDAEVNGPPPESFGKSIEYVYDRHVLLRTWLALRGRNNVEVPTDIELLIEAVYGSDEDSPDQQWREALCEAKENMERSHAESEKAAGRLLVSKPKDPFDLIEDFNDRLVDDEDPEVHKAVRAATREGDPSMSVIFVEADAITDAEPDLVGARDLLDRSVKLSHKGVFHALLSEGESPPAWTGNAHLRGSRLVRLDSRGSAVIGDYLLFVDEDLGVVIRKAGEE